jgi:hypothetical protein
MYSTPLLMMLLGAVAHGIRPRAGEAWYAGGAGVPLLALVAYMLANRALM